MNRMKVQHPIILLVHLLLILLIVAALIACRSQPVEAPEIRIGLLVPLSGELQDTHGKPTVEGAELAVKLVNDAGGLEVGGQKHKVKLIIEDHEDSSTRAANVAQMLINQENVVALVGLPLSRNAIPVADVAEVAQIPMISSKSTNPATTADKEYVFRVSFVDDFQGEMIARFVIEELELHKAAILYNVADPYSTGLADVFADVFEKAGAEVVAMEQFTTDMSNLDEQLMRIKESQPDVLLLPNFPNQVPMQVQRARELGIKAIFLGGDAWGALSPAETPELEGAFLTGHWHPEVADEHSKAFISLYQKNYHNLPNSWVTLSYDAVNLLFQAIQNQDQATPSAIRNGLASIGRFHGVTGTLEYRGTGNPIRSAVILQFKNGKAEFYKQINP